MRLPTGRSRGAGGRLLTASLRPIAAPFVAAAPGGARVRARLRVSARDEAVLWAAGTHLGSLAGKDLAARCAEGRLDAKGRARSRAVRKRALTAVSSSRWAGAITRTSEDQVRLAGRRVSPPGRAACQGPSALGGGGPAGRRRGATGGGGRVRGPGREGPAAQEEQSCRRRADPGPVAAGVGIGPAVPDRRRRGWKGLGERDDPLEPRPGLARDQAPRPAGPSREPAARPVSV